MTLYNLKNHSEEVSFTQAVLQGLGKNQGLFFPKTIPFFTKEKIENLIAQDFISRSTQIITAYIGDELTESTVYDCVKNAFPFPIPVKKITPTIGTMELFHGPTFAFKDFGGRFMAQVLSKISQNKKITILTATSGDTGAAVAHAFYNSPTINVVILYPKGKISNLQERLFCTLGGNITTLAVDGDFDACQTLVKQAFDDETLRTEKGLNSANSINISRLLAQMCYYFEGYANLSQTERENLVVSVPSGNFGNLTAGLLAQASGLPIKRFIAATNSNDTIPRYLENGKWAPSATVATLSNAMDVSKPNNWPRIEELFKIQNKPLSKLSYGSVSDETTKETIKELDSLGYVSEPHGAVAYRVLKDQLKEKEFGLFLGTAHPAKFIESVEEVLQKKIEIPEGLSKRATMPILSKPITARFEDLRKTLYSV